MFFGRYFFLFSLANHFFLAPAQIQVAKAGVLFRQDELWDIMYSASVHPHGLPEAHFIAASQIHDIEDFGSPKGELLEEDGSWRSQSLVVKLFLVEFHINGCFQPKNRGKHPPKWMGENVMENPMNKWMIWGVKNPIFGNIQMVNS